MRTVPENPQAQLSIFSFKAIPSLFCIHVVPFAWCYIIGGGDDISKQTGPTITAHARGGYYTTLTIDGKKKFLYGNTKEIVMKKYIEARYERSLGSNISYDPTMMDYSVKWYNLFKKGKGAVKTQEMYSTIVNAHIIPTLGSKKIKGITTSDIQELLNSKDFSRSLQHKIRITLNQIFKNAQADRLVTINPVAATAPIKTPPPSRKFYSAEQREILKVVLHEHNIFPLAYAVLNTGMRITEIIALMRHRDLDLVNNKIYVRESTEFKNYQPERTDAGTLRIREIPIPSTFSAWLGNHMDGTGESDYVFPGYHGGQMGLTELRNTQRRANYKLETWFDEAESIQNKTKTGKKLIESELKFLHLINNICGAKPIIDYRFKLYFKALRHTYCTGLYDLGLDEISASNIMGLTVTSTREIYNHILKERKGQSKINIEMLYSGKLTETPISGNDPQP
ncbi:MAG: tyrosine-type recombinase/integrase [Firmicutes bacterium]|nr:tyrosine-type recombinase/integrase [Bacillota bacterium]